MRRSLFAFALLVSPGCAAAADAARRPAFLEAGPYGDPFALVARSGVLLQGVAAGIPGERPSGERASGAPSSMRIAPVGGSAGVPGRKKEDDEDDEDDDDPVPSKPGSFPTTFMKVPDPVPNQKKRSMGPHLRPDAEFNLDDKTTVGIISQLDRLRTAAPQSILGKTTTTTGVSSRSVTGIPGRGRDVGFGASLEFKLGQ